MGALRDRAAQLSLGRSFEAWPGQIYCQNSATCPSWIRPAAHRAGQYVWPDIVGILLLGLTIFLVSVRRFARLTG